MLTLFWTRTWIKSALSKPNIPRSAASRAEKDFYCILGDAGYRGIEKRVEHHHRQVDWFMAMRPGTRRIRAMNSDAGKVEFR